MKDRDSIFNKIQEFLFSRNNDNSLGNDAFAVDNQERIHLCAKCGKLLVLFDNIFSVFCTKRGKFTDKIHNRLLLDLEHIRKCWVQLNMSITPKLYIILSHAPFLLLKFNGGFDKLEESHIESSHQSRARDHCILVRMGDKRQADKFEVKLQNIRMNKEISKMQHEVNKFAKRKIKLRSLSLKKERENESRNQRVLKQNRVKEKSEETGTTTKTLSAQKRKHNALASI